MLGAMRQGLLTTGALGALLLSACTLLPVDAGPERDLAGIAKFEGRMTHSGLLFLEGREPIWTAPTQESKWTLSEFAITELMKNGEFVEGYEVVDQHVKALNGYHLVPVNPNGVAVVKKPTETEPGITRVILIHVPGSKHLIVVRCACGLDRSDCNWIYFPDGEGWRCSGALCECAVDGIITHPDRGVIRF